jgi:hypothetical protein
VRDKEANASGHRPETFVRGITEFYIILKNFLWVETFEEMVSIFPEAINFYHEDGFEPHYVLAMVALGEKSQHCAKSFALGLLFDLLCIESKAKKIKSLYGFDYMEFIALTAKYDTFLHEALAQRDGQIISLSQSVAERDGQIASIYGSHSWRLTRPFRVVSRLISRKQGFSSWRGV